ncbi:hypothetical protein [Streptomyces sp. NPDC021224]|uniref:hypothetical protein n=1 Tax=unclassified Streptomyces TaxID=2593676 RepID=UPI0037BBE290
MTPQDDNTPGGTGRFDARADSDGRVYQAGRDLHVHPGLRAPSWKVVLGGLTVAGVLATVAVLNLGGDGGAHGEDERGAPPAGGTGPSPGSSVAATTSSAPAPVTASPKPAPPSPSTDEVRWHGSLHLTFVDLDTVPAHVLSSNNQADFWVYYPGGEREGSVLYGQNGGFFTTNPTVAQWDGKSSPDKHQCSDTVATQGSEELPIDIGSRYCVQTSANRYAYVVVKGFDASNGYEGTATVWS